LQITDNQPLEIIEINKILEINNEVVSK